jgi:threonine 3-dehydrogenase
MKAVVKTSKVRGAEFMDVDMPTTGAKDVLIKVRVVAICGTDIHIFQSSPTVMSRINLPCIFGHEMCGDVIETGDHVTNIKKGDIVAVETHIPCGTCYQCQTGAEHICNNLELFGSRTGAFAEYTTVPEICCWKLPKGTSYDLGAILEPLGVAVHSALVEDMNGINGKSVAIFGCGPIGLFAIGAVAAFGATKIFALEVIAKRLAMASKLFPDAILINPKEQDPIKTIMEATDGLGVDIAIDLSGDPGATNQALKALRCGGRVSLVGIPPGLVELDIYRDVILKGAKIIGIFGRIRWQTWWQVRNLLGTGKFDPLSVVTHRFPLADFAKAIELAASGQAGKVLLYP